MNTSQITQQQREFFDSNATKPISFRLRQLQLLKSTLQSNESRLYSAIHQDYGKGEFDTFLTELYIIYDEIDTAVRELPKWASRKPTGSNMLTSPGQSFIMPEPLGVSLVIGPWNYPYQLALAPIVAAMAAGCTVVLKPSELTVNSSGLLAELLGKAFNPAYLSVVLGGVSETTELLEQRFDMIFFTGSVPVGKIVYQAAAKHLTPVVLELGGKSPVIIGPDADLEITVKRLVWAKFLNAGQTCIAPDYVCVHASIADEFIAKLKREIESAAYCVDDDSLVQIVNKRNTERLVKLIDPAKVILGGKWNIDERVIEPTVMAGVAWDDKVMQEEIFGPLLPIMTYTNIDKIISEIKARPKPLSLYLFTRDEALKEKILVEISFGGGCVNEAVMHIANGHLPFGGVGDSGIGSYHGEQGFRSFSHFKSVFEKQLVPDPDVKYTPHTAEKLAMLRQITTA